MNIKNLNFKKIQWIMALLIFASATVLFAKAKLGNGTVVWAEWTKNSWYHGKIAGSCESGWMIHFDDGDKKCCEPEAIAADVAPEASELQEGMKVIAEWTDNRYYPGIISSITSDAYNIVFDDGDKRTVGISQIRLRGN